MESTINEMLGKAINVINENQAIRIPKDPAKKIDSIYESYLSQFGPMVVELELPSTFAVYCNTDSGSEGKREYIIEMIYKIINNYHSNYFAPIENYDNWKKEIMQNSMFANKHEQIILDASVALKRAIRTFEMAKKN